jgi:hypothetical protein
MQRSRLVTGLLAALAAASMAACAAGGLDPTNGDPCAGQRSSYTLQSFAAVQGKDGAEGSTVPLRCGKVDPKGWGYRHFGSRFAGVAQEFSDDIQTTLDSGKRTRVNKDSVLYVKDWGSCGCAHQAMTVFVSLVTQQPDQGIRGIITAYWKDNPDNADPSVMASEYDPGT